MSIQKKYHDLTLEEIKAKYYVNFVGEEDSGTLKYINGRLSKLWQDVSYYYNDTNSKLKNAKKVFDRLERQLKLDEAKIKWKYITENKVLKTRDRWSDAARETGALIETRNEKLNEQLDTIYTGISELEEEFAVWKTVKDNLAFIAKRVDTSSMNIAVEAKLTSKEPTNIPDSDPVEVEKDINEGIKENVKTKEDLF